MASAASTTGSKVKVSASYLLMIVEFGPLLLTLGLEEVDEEARSDEQGGVRG